MVVTRPNEVLLVDDSPTNIYSLEVVLSSLENLVLIKANTVEQLFEQLESRHIAMVLLSNDMQQTDGLTLTEKIKANPRHKKLPILLISNTPLSANKIVSGYENGAIDFLCKPIEPRILLKKVQHFLALVQLQTQSQQHQNEQALILAAAGHGVVEITSKGQIIYANSKACELLNRTATQIQSKNFNHWFADSDDDSDDIEQEIPLLKQLFAKTLKYGDHKQRGLLLNHQRQIAQNNTQNSTQKGIPIEITCTINTNRQQKLLVLVFQDISHQLTLEQQLVKMANLDPLTGLANRNYFNLQVKRAITWSKRETVTFALLMIDLDRFKAINDNHGHDIGDWVLKTSAKRLKTIIRVNDTAARLGGDEFAVILENVRSPKAAEKVAEKLIIALSQPIKSEQLQLEVCASIGIACCHGGLPNISQLTKWADTALYAAKANGRNQFQRYIPAMTEQAHLQSSLHHYMQHLIENHLFETYFQPIFCIKNQNIIGFEALARLPDLSKASTTILPAVFMPIAEQSHLTHKIYTQVLQSAAHLLTQLQQHKHTENMQVSINISAKQLNEKHFLSTLQQVLNQGQFQPQRLVLELTEATLLSEDITISDTLRQIQQTGVKLALDDFGTGISGLNSIIDYPFDWIKIDPHYIHKINFCRKTQQLVKTTIELANNLNLVTVAEAVENEQQLELLQHLGCKFIQGGYYCLATPIEQLSAQLQQYNQIEITLD